MKVKFVSEGINFERGQDPKDAMGIGLFNKRKFEDIDDLSDWIIQVMPKIMEVPEIPKDILGTSSGLFLEEDYYEEIENWILDNNLVLLEDDLDDWAGEVGAKLMQQGFEKVPLDTIEESVNFERGQDPKDAMGIGLSKMERFLMKVDELAEEFGFYSRLVKEPDQYTNVHIRKYERRNQDTLDLWAYRQGPLEPVDIRDRKMGNIFSSYKFVHWGAPDRKVPAEDWGKKKTWKRIFGKPAKKDYNWNNESVNFERGKDPKTAMGIGASKDAYEITKAMRRYDGRLGTMPEKPFLEILEDPTQWNRNDILLKGPPIGDHNEWKTINLMSSEYPDIIYKGKYYNLRQPTDESVNFERGKDPRAVMGIGNEGMAIKMIDEQVNPLGLTMNPPYDILSPKGGNARGRIYVWKSRPQSSEVELDVYHDGRMTFYAVNSEDGYISLSELDSIMELLEKKELYKFINLM